jgi:predicted amidohydrolase
MKQYVKYFAILILLAASGLTCPSETCSLEGTVKVAMAQIFCLDGDRSGNFVRIENAIIQAKDKGAEIVTFPETSILGWVNPDAHTRAYPIPGPDSERLCALARKYQVFICIGLAEKEGDKLFDSAILIDNEGNILLKHRKINTLDELMSPPYTKGDKVEAVNTRLGRIGMMICADSFQEDVLLKMKEQRPDWIIIPYGWAANENDWPDHGKELLGVVQNAARVVNCPIVGTDLVGEITHGPWRDMVYGGQSVAVDKQARILATGRDRDKDIVIFELRFVSDHEH